MKNIKDSGVFTISAAILTRLVLIIHTVVVVWALYVGENDARWWLFTVLIFPMVVELILVVVRNRGHEWNSIFCASIFLYLISVLPPIWILEFEQIENTKNNITGSTKTFAFDVFGTSKEPVLEITFASGIWLMAMEQSMVFLLIFARWLLPTGHMSYNQLSNILLLHIGTVADILELLEMFQLRGAVENWKFVYAVLAVFSLGLLQFTIVIVPADVKTGENLELLPKSHEEERSCLPLRDKQEVATIIQSIVMMHMPVVAIRVTAIVIYGISLYSNIFFLIKNCLMLIINVNRMAILCCRPKEA